ncbi:putative MFS family arabinose efflux permease [Motilibacter rhizosphaerae]|uniref:Putative MFS family arabinose efflux permease n=1 Tax=Motilibacter rhizosphaerae TaxID=598652 RepID=A0A4Q7NFN8_9ACTN|nr:MFS transporter [Motilibacter rhizosphaerae]RZS82727.1 putative MFS family arabinose efflux permease [Motilibacter rhizosphaerae]
MPSSPLVRARSSVAALFVLMGTVSGSWAGRIPGVRAQVGVSEGRWGLLSTAGTVGSLVGIALVASLVRRTGPRRLALAGAALLLLDAPVAALSGGPLALVAALLVQGFAFNLLSTPMNAQAVEVEREYARPILATFHACFSVGQLTGGLLGILAAQAGLSPARQLGVTAVVLAGLLLAASHGLPADVPPPAREHRRGLRSRVTPQLALLGAIAFCSSIGEGGAGQWSALYTSDTLGAGAALGAATFSCFSLAMFLARSKGDVIVARLGRVAFLRAAALVAACGIGLALVGGVPATALIGFAVLGLGLGCIVPTAYGLAGNQPGLTPGEGISVAVLGQWPAFLLGPPLIGALAQASSLRVALLLVVAAALAVTMLSTRLHGAERAPVTA